MIFFFFCSNIKENCNELYVISLLIMPDFKQNTAAVLFVFSFGYEAFIQSKPKRSKAKCTVCDINFEDAGISNVKFYQTLRSSLEPISHLVISWSASDISRCHQLCSLGRLTWLCSGFTEHVYLMSVCYFSWHMHFAQSATVVLLLHNIIVVLIVI